MSWIKNMSSQQSLDILGQLSGACAALGGPLAKQIHDLVLRKDYLALTRFEIDYTASYTLLDFTYSRQILGFFAKADFLDIGVDKECAALDRFFDAEDMCHKTNVRIRDAASRPQLVDPAIQSVMSTAQWKIARILGGVPSLGILPFGFGPGANTNVKGTLSCPRAKLGVDLECSSDMVPTVASFLYETPAWASAVAASETLDAYVCDVSVVPGKVIFVPKNAKTHRSIAVEPILNSFFQSGVGKYIALRLKRFGVDLSDQSRNQSLARRGSIDGSLATVDISMASDCLASELVWSLLPYDWCALLSSLRTSEVTISVSGSASTEIVNRRSTSKASTLSLNKFSSMGNGFTFELESLIFYALALSVCEVLDLPTEDVSVFGDDIIIPTPAYELLGAVLQHSGFSMNMDKSFASGSFRESCGADYFKGFDIRPYYQKTVVSERTLYSMHNWFVRHGEYQLAALVKSLCNPALALFGPDGFGDGHLIGNHSLRYPRNVKRSGWDGGYFDTYALKKRFYKRPLPGDVALPSYSVYTRSGERSATDPDVVRGSSGYTKISIYTLSRSIFSSQG